MHRNAGAGSIVRPGPSRPYAVWLAFGVVSLVAATGWSAAMTLTSGPSEWAAASGASWSPLSHFVAGSLGLGKVPHPVPAVVSPSSAAPTELPVGSTAYVLDGRGTAGNDSLNFTINETVGQPAGTEFELEFTVNATEGSGFTLSSVDVFIETQTNTTRAPYSFTFVYDLDGASGLGSVRATEVIVACPAGECP